MRRVVVTGLGMVSPLGCGVDTNWRRLVAGENGFGRVEAFDVSDLPCKIAVDHSARRRLRRHLQSDTVDGAEGAA
jgi:3-oxoacyl-(acyl-carrier-protein) synthase